MTENDFTTLALNTIRFLAVDQTEAAKSGHPGTPMGDAAIAWCLWMNHMKYNPKNPDWPNRDRFILSSGHACALQYAMLYITGYDLPLEELKRFRQLHSRTPGHPEYGITPGIETTTGPLGQGFATAVGMAMGERYLADYFNRPNHDIIDYNIYVLCGDGDMMEGITSEAASLAGHLALSKIICIYSDNRISIEGSTDITFTENVSDRFRAYGWFVQDIDGTNIDEIDNAIKQAKEQSEKPSFIHARTIIGYGSPSKQNTKEAHGEPLGPEEAKRTKENLGWPTEPAFYVPDEVLKCTRSRIEIGKQLEEDWQRKMEQYAAEYPDLAKEWNDSRNMIISQDSFAGIKLPDVPAAGTSTREASGKMMNALAPSFPFMIGGSADLAPSTKTYLEGYPDFTPQQSGRNIHFGVREHAMGAALNGMALTKPIIPFGGTFLVFSDYMKPAIRLAAIMHLRVVYVFSHDSFLLGEDGTTHQPVEHLQALRAIPDLLVIRPADAAETYAAWQVALLNNNGPSALILSRQKLPSLERKQPLDAQLLMRGAYVIWQNKDGKPDVILIATGSEVALSIEAGKLLANEGINARVVNMPCCELFDEQSDEYKEEILPSDVCARVAVEAAYPDVWWKYVGLGGSIVGMPKFGTSAPMADLQKLFGFTPENVAAVARKTIANNPGK